MRTLFLILLILIVTACSDFADSVAGLEGEKCFGNGTCKDGLICEEGLCVKDGTAGNDNDSGDTGDTSDTGDTGNTGNTGDSGDSGNTDADKDDYDDSDDDSEFTEWEKSDDDSDVSDPCDPNPCTGETNSNGDCTSVSDSYYCQCDEGFHWNYSSLDCETNPDPCIEVSTCPENGHCEPEKTEDDNYFTGNYECVCNAGFVFNDTETSCHPSYRSVSCGKDHVCAIDHWNKLYCWGSNFNGQLGGTTPVGAGQLEKVPTKVNDMNWLYVKAGEAHTCGITDGSDLYCWGYNFYGQIGNGENGSGQEESAPVLVSASYSYVSTGRNHTCAIKSDDKLYCWGWNLNGQLGSNDNNNYDYPLNIQSTYFWNNISAGYLHTCGIDANSKLFCWGENTNGQLGDSTNVIKNIPVQIGTDMWSKISCGEDHTCAVRSDNGLYCWGGNSDGQLGDNQTNTDRNAPYLVYTIAKTVSSGAKHTCSISTGGALTCWGKNNYGQLGTGDTQSKNSPYSVNGESWIDVSAGNGFTCGIKSSGALYCWGVNEFGQIGINTVTGTYPDITQVIQNK